MHFDLLSLSGVPERDEAIARIAWSEGLQLLPQHFQSLDARLEGLLQRHALARNPYFWGIDTLKIDERALTRGKLNVAAAAGCFSDGLLFAWNSLRNGPLECVLETGVKPIRYALAVPRENFIENGINVGRYKHFVADLLADQTNTDEKAAILRLLPNLSIRKWDALNPLYAQIPIVEVTKTATGFAATGFHPPAARLIPESLCAGEIVGLIGLLRAKASQLDVLAVSTPLTAEYRPGLNWILSSLVSGLPLLEAQMASTAAHPYDLFLSICKIAGAVSPLAGRPPDYFPAYNHEDPGASLSVVVRYVREVVNPIGMSPSRWSEIPFVFADGEWMGPAPARQTQGELLVRVSFDKESAESAVASWLQHALICFSDEKGRCREARVRGLGRRIQSLPEVGLEAAPGEWYIRIDVRDSSDVTDRQLIIAGPNARSGLVLSRVSLMKLTAD